MISNIHNLHKQTSIHKSLSKKLLHILKYFHTHKVSSLYYQHCQTYNISTSTWNICPRNFQVHRKWQANIEIVVSHFIISFKCWILEAVPSGNALPVNNPFLYQLLSEKSHYFKIFCPSFCRFISRLAFIFSPFSNMDLVMIPGGTGATASYNPISLYLCLANSTRLCKTMQFIQMNYSDPLINVWILVLAPIHQ